MLYFAAFFVVLFAACDKKDDDTPPKVKQKIAVVPHDGDIKHLTLDSVCVLRSAEQFESLIANKDGIPVPNVDFSSVAILAVNGIAPASVSDIVPQLYSRDGKYTLSLSVSVDKSRGVMPRKWSLLLSAPFDVASQVELDVEFDMAFDKMALPADSEWYNEFYSFMPLLPIDSAYMVVLRDEDAVSRLTEIVNADEDCILIRPTRTQLGYGDKVSSTIYETYHNGEYSSSKDFTYHTRVLKNCDYDKIVAPLLGDEIWYSAKAIADHYDIGLGYHVGFDIPMLNIGVGDINDREALLCLLRSVGYVLEESNGRLYTYMYEKAPVSQTQIHYLLGADGYVNDAKTVNPVYFQISQHQFDNAVKEHYE